MWTLIAENLMFALFILFCIIIFVFLVLLKARAHIKDTKTTVGLGRFIVVYLILDPFLFVIRWFPGGWGMFLRYGIYKLLFKKLGKNAVILEGTKILYFKNIEIGDYCSLNENCFLYGKGNISIGSWVRIGRDVSLITEDHIFLDRSTLIKKQGVSLKPIVVSDDVWICANVTVLKGVTIGTGAVVGAGAVVTKDIPEYAIVAGVPARIIGWRGDEHKEDK